MRDWSADPLQLAAIAFLAVLYAVRARRLHARRSSVARSKPLLFALGVLALLFAAISPLDYLGEERLFSAHMAQHLLIGDVAPLFMVLGVTGALVRPLLALPFVMRAQALAHPAVAVSIWTVNLFAWHAPPLFEAGLGHPAVHAAEHLCFFAAGTLLWAAVLEPVRGRRRLAPGIRLSGLAGAWAAGGLLANVLLWSDGVYYTRYLDAPRTAGLSAVADQRLGGGIMLLEMSTVMITAGVWLALQWFRDTERHQQLIDAGTPPTLADRLAAGRHE